MAKAKAGAKATKKSPATKMNSPKAGIKKPAAKKHTATKAATKKTEPAKGVTGAAKKTVAPSIAAPAKKTTPQQAAKSAAESAQRQVGQQSAGASPATTSIGPQKAEQPEPKAAAVAARAATAPIKPAKAEEEAASAIEAAEQPETISELDGVRLPTTRGKVGVFGGPKDHSAKPDDKLALPTGRHFQYERVRSLNAKSFYCAMRWDYRQKHMSPEEGKRWWANKKLLVTNAANGRSAVVRAVDYGPHENTGLAIAVSPGAAEVIGAAAGDEVEVVFADQKAPLGPI